MLSPSPPPLALQDECAPIPTMSHRSGDASRVGKQCVLPATSPPRISPQAERAHSVRADTVVPPAPAQSRVPTPSGAAASKDDVNGQSHGSHARAEDLPDLARTACLRDLRQDKCDRLMTRVTDDVLLNPTPAVAEPVGPERPPRQPVATSSPDPLSPNATTGRARERERTVNAAAMLHDKMEGILAKSRAWGHVGPTRHHSLPLAASELSPLPPLPIPIPFKVKPISSTQSPTGKKAQTSFEQSISRRPPSPFPSPNREEPSEEDSFSGAPEPRDYTEMFDLHDAHSPTQSDDPRRDPSVELDDLPRGDPRPHVCYVARHGDVGRPLNLTPPMKSIVRGDVFLADQVEASQYVRQSQSPETHTDGWSGGKEEFVAAADLSRPITYGIKSIGPPPVYPEPPPPRVSASATLVESPRLGSPAPIFPPGRPQQPIAPREQRSPSPLPRNRFTQLRPVDCPASAPALVTHAGSFRSAPPRAAAARLGGGAFAGAQADSDSPPSGDVVPLPDTFDDEEDEDVQADAEAQEDEEAQADSHCDEGDDPTSRHPPTRIAKGKGKANAHNASSGPSRPLRGRPTTEDNQEIERVAQEIHGNLVELANKLGLSYDTLVRKMGFSQQEVRESNLSNIFKQVHKQRLIAAGKPKETAAQYHAAFRQWQIDHCDDPGQVAALWKEHALIPQDTAGGHKPAQQIAKQVSTIAQQMADMGNSYYMSSNIAVVGAVIHLGSTDAAQTFAPTLGLQAALVNGFGLNEQASLLKAKAMLMHVLRYHDEKDITEVPAPSTDSRWALGKNKRDSLRTIIRCYLTDILCQIDTKAPLKWDPRKWPTVAAEHGLVLTGWGPDITTLPTDGWTDKKTGLLTRAQWQSLVERIPQSYHGNPFHNVSEGQLLLEIVPLDGFLAEHKEYEGRHPCVVNHVGRALYFVDEAPQVIKGTATKKAKASTQQKSSSSQRKPPPVPLPRTESSDSEGSSDSAFNAPGVRFTADGPETPSGPSRKRARLAASNVPPLPPSPPAGIRPVKPMPARSSGYEKKRKRGDVTPVVEAAQPVHPDEPRQPLPEPARPIPVGRAGQHADLRMPPPAHSAPNLAFHQAGFPPPFALQAPYPPHPTFAGPLYGPPGYPPHYGPQGWGPPPPQHAHQAWVPPPAQYHQEDLDPTTQMRRGGYSG
ncbi:hypothetical protein FIBSPDRAFT_953313 [Athelia psychrophila]|uniref:Uncharacterized protein n=1 Tax=Athelia psychrophila TaxID=1759441 RepID=A0A166KK62_9AGAM|nr:hypothetical protein FIBSPDRAFT_953313 [Fibularhizoctonia sp. CBS 109695]